MYVECTVVSRSVVLTPSSTSITACPSEEIFIQCSESDTTAEIDLRWKITPENRAFQRVDMHLSNFAITNRHLVAGVHLYSELISQSPLVAILMTTAHPILNGATVMCITTTSMDTLTIEVLEGGNQFIS